MAIDCNIEKTHVPSGLFMITFIMVAWLGLCAFTLLTAFGNLRMGLCVSNVLLGPGVDLIKVYSILFAAVDSTFKASQQNDKSTLWWAALLGMWDES